MKSCLLATFIVLSGFAFIPGADDAELSGTWARKSDALRIQVSPEGDSRLASHIIAEGNEKFPCEVSHLPIYKNITRIGRNLWTCDFLVVTMGSCSTDYEEGIIQLMKNGDMEVTCPGFDKKIYTKQKPRYEN
jgi:hypothetical protein